MAILCRDYGVNDIFISAMICRRDKFFDGKVKRVHFLFKLICEENGHFFTDNSNIEIRDLLKDGIHLLESGKTKLAEIFIFFKHFLLTISLQLFLNAHTQGNIEHTYSQFEPISTKSILNTSTSNEVNNRNNNVLKNLRLKNSNKVIIGHININSLGNKFELLTEMVQDKVDLLMISETNLDSSFPNAQFYMKSYSKP